MAPLQCRPNSAFLSPLAAVLAAASTLAVPPLTSSPLPGSAPATVHRAPDDPVTERIRARLEAGGRPLRMTAAGTPIHAGSALPTFYERRAFRPAWSEDRRPRPAADSLLAALEAADREGLRPEDYHLEALRKLRRRIGDGGPAGAGALAELDLLLTDAFLTYGDHLADGRVDPVTLHSDWVPGRSGVDLVAVLERALDGDGVRRALEDLLPPQEGYRRLREAWLRHREIAAGGGWPEVADGPRLAPGDTSGRVSALRARLRATGELAPEARGGPTGPAVDTVYGPALAEAVRRFQRRHGLEDDAVVGPATLAALNVPAGERARQLRVNLERWRWLPRSLGERHVRVNAADFDLDVVEGGEVVLSTRAIVGRPYRKTPVMSDRITYLVFSPFWHVPHSLAVQDQLPLQKRDPAYFRRMGFRLFRGRGADAAEVDPDSVDWSAVSAGSFPYRLRQDPGPANALGGVKFMFPNRFSVYLHDTPARELFARRGRSFSSGCIRVEEAAELAAGLLRDDPAWTPEAIRAAMEAGAERTVSLPEPVPVHLLYWTAFAGGGTVQFRPDVYGRDDAVRAALEEAPPRPASTPAAVDRAAGGDR